MLEFLGEPRHGKEGKRRLVGVMVRDQKLYASTGGWGYGNFPEGSRTNSASVAEQNACYQCHVSRKDHGYVFTEYTER